MHAKHLHADSLPGVCLALGLVTLYCPTSTGVDKLVVGACPCPLMRARASLPFVLSPALSPLSGGKGERWVLEVTGALYQGDALHSWCCCYLGIRW